MSEISRIQDQLTRAVVNKTWASSSLLETLEGVTTKQALKRPLADAHNIWEIVLHIITWMDVVRIAVEGGKWQPTEEEDWPKVKSRTKADWEKTQAKLKLSYQKLYKAIGKLKESEVDKIPKDRQNSNYVIIHGAIQHNLYHTGQIALIKKSF